MVERLSGGTATLLLVWLIGVGALSTLLAAWLYVWLVSGERLGVGALFGGFGLYTALAGASGPCVLWLAGRAQGHSLGWFMLTGAKIALVMVAMVLGIILLATLVMAGAAPGLGDALLARGAHGGCRRRAGPALGGGDLGGRPLDRPRSNRVLTDALASDLVRATGLGELHLAAEFLRRGVARPGAVAVDRQVGEHQAQGAAVARGCAGLGRQEVSARLGRNRVLVQRAERRLAQQQVGAVGQVAEPRARRRVGGVGQPPAVGLDAESPARDVVLRLDGRERDVPGGRSASDPSCSERRKQSSKCRALPTPLARSSIWSAEPGGRMTRSRCSFGLRRHG